ncbi:MAG: hypothetical protein ACXWRE_12475, partial [Pseudobdellovibrionaceae bacterium]
MKQFIIMIIIILGFNLWSTLSVASPQACKYVSEGAVQQSWKKIRIQNLNGVILAGADSFSEAINLGRNLLDSRACVPQLQDCRLASEGIIGGLLVKHRIQMDRE